MNIITWCTAISLYPYATFELETSLLLQPTTDNVIHGIAKYNGRGFECVVDPGNISSFKPGLRRIGDTKSWVIPLSLDVDFRKQDVLGIPNGYNPVKVNCWELVDHGDISIGPNSIIIPRMATNFTLAHSAFLKFTYTSIAPLLREFYPDLKYLAKTEYAKLSVDVREQFKWLFDSKHPIPHPKPQLWN